MNEVTDSSCTGKQKSTSDLPKHDMEEPVQWGGGQCAVRNFSEIVIKFLRNNEEHIQEFKEFKEYLTQEIAMLKKIKANY